MRTGSEDGTQRTLLKKYVTITTGSEMQTFLPYRNFEKSAMHLDNKRLGKQRVECLQILKALTNPKYGWKNHPAVKMWKGYEHALVEYGIEICDEWVGRGFKDTCREKIVNIALTLPFRQDMPEWLGDEKLHASHRANLKRKDPEFYGRFAWDEPDYLPYVWPVQ